METAQVEWLGTSEYGLQHDECIWVSRYAVRQSGRFERHHHPDGQLFWVDGGQVMVQAEGYRWMLSPSRAVWVPGDTWHTVQCHRDAELYCVYLWEEECPPSFAEAAAFTVDALARELLRMLAEPDLTDDLARKARGLLLAILEPAPPRSLDLPMPNDDLARRVAEEVLDAPDLPHRLSEWSRALYTSEKSIQRAFLTETGMSYSAWRTRARMLCALPLLSEQMPVSVVAGRIGYASVNGFASAFRREFGTTPGLYHAS